MSPRGRRCAAQTVNALFGLALMACAAPNPAYNRGGDAAAGLLVIDATAQPLADALGQEAQPAAAECPQRADLALCVRFEGQVVDESQYRVPLVARGVRFATGGPAGTAADLDATSLISLADNPLFDLETVTIEAWVKPRSAGGRMGIVDYDGQYGMFIQANGTALCEGSNGASYVTSGVLTVGAWVSISCAFDRTMANLWIEGAPIDSAARTGPLRTASTTGITLGSDGAQGNPFDGQIDNIRIWRVVRTTAQICAGAHNCR
jgi:hypothetical protein